MVAVVTTAGLLVLARKFSHRLVAASPVLRVYKPRRCGAEVWGEKTASVSSKFDRYCKRGMWVKGAEMWLAPYYEV